MSSAITTIVEAIDTELGSGFAAEHPELLAAYLIARAIDGLSCVIENNGLLLEDIGRAASRHVNGGKKRRLRRTVV